MEGRKQHRLFSHLIDLRGDRSKQEDRAREPLAPQSDADGATKIRNQESPDPSVSVAAEPHPAANQGPSLAEALDRLQHDFVWIAPGRFIMGSPRHESGRGDDEQDHEVVLSEGFYLQRVPVSQGLWQAVMESNPAAFAGVDFELPMERVSWQDCQEFLRKLDSLTGLRHRLPTEAEWEYACRAGSPHALANGRLIRHYCDPDPNLDRIAWYCGNSGRRPQPVGSKEPNAWGLFDMHGNVWEWCSDWYGPYNLSPQVDPTGPRSGMRKVVRGGSWFSNAGNCRSAARFSLDPDSASDLTGFRVLRSP